VNIYKSDGIHTYKEIDGEWVHDPDTDIEDLIYCDGIEWDADAGVMYFVEFEDDDR
jgi:hypothetical protein